MMASIFSRFRAASRVLFGGKSQRRGYDAVKAGRLYSDWFAHATSSDTETRNSIRKLIDRSRDLERNNDYQRGFLFAVERNVLGAIKNDLRMDAGEYTSTKAGPPTWTPDRSANALIESAWTEWGRRGTCTICGRYSWREVKRLVVRAIPRDGNIVVRKVRGAAAGNRFQFALQVLEIDHLDLEKFDVLRNGAGEIRFGIEFNANRRAVAYWLKVKNPGDLTLGTAQSPSVRISAHDIYHAYVAERAEQSIGVPWIVSAITRLRQLGAFEEAATIAARLGASKAGFFRRTPGPNGEIGEFTGETSANGAPQMEVAPGSFEALPDGWQLDSWDPAYPNIETGDFRKAMLRGVATSVGMSYTTLGNDLESVNFSSARVGLFEEREMWKSLQLWFLETLWEPIFGDWLEASMQSGAVALPLAKFPKFNRPLFKSRRWPFIDPAKEVSAAREAVALRITSRQQVIEESGGDRDDVFLDNLSDEKYAEEIGLTLAPPDVMPESFGNLADMAKKDGEAEETPAKKKLKADEDERAMQQPALDAIAKRIDKLETHPPIVVNNHITQPEQRAPEPPRVTLHQTPLTGQKTVEPLERDPKTKEVTKLRVTTKKEAVQEFAVERADDGTPKLTELKK